MQRAMLISMVGAAATTVAMVGYERSAEACGACFAPTSEVTTVDSHRMVIALGMEETVLWDQIVYSGNPADFVWVLPVPSPEVTVEVADPAFFDMLDRGTAPTISPAYPLRTGCPGGGGIGCGGAVSASGESDAPSDGVTVYNEGTVGPYETVTVGAESRNALYDWLTGRGYEITPASLPVIEHYLDLGYVFVALRLQPGVGVQAMQPVRARYPGFMGTFPLKGVVVGAKGVVDLSLWVIAEQRYEANNYATVEIDEFDLVWDWATNTSNYGDVFDDTILDAGGRAWVTEYAGNLSWIPVVGNPYDDLAIANSVTPTPFVTRLRTRLRTENINEDLLLAPAADASPVSQNLLAYAEINRPAEPDCSDGCAAGDHHAAKLSSLMLLLIGAIVALRRRRRRR